MFSSRTSISIFGFPVMALTLAASLALLSGCGDTGTKTATTATTFTELYNNTLKVSVTCKGCHISGGAGTTAGAALDFSTQALAYSTLTQSTVAGGSSVGTCSSVRIVTASDPTRSYIVGMFVTSYQTANFGGKSGCTPINTHSTAGYMSAAEQSALLSWINAGAPNN